MGRAARGFLAGVGMLALAGTQMGGCGPGAGSGAGTSTVVITNSTDSFTVAVVGFDYDGKVDRNWTCTKPQANLTIGSSMAAGSVHIVVRDGLGALVYDNTHEGVGGLDVQTRAGASGLWRVIMDFSDATLSGAITLEADDPPTLDSVSLSSALGTSDAYLFHAEWGAVTADVSVASVSSGSLEIRIWHGGQDPLSDSPFFEATVGSGGLAATTAAGLPGTWTIELDFSGASLAGSLSITSN
jgi:hypothetical protein